MTASNRAEPSVLPIHSSEEEESLLQNGDSRRSAKRPTAAPLSPFSAPIFYFLAIHFLLAFCEMILVAPLIKLFEESLCLRHYSFPPGGVPEKMCKIPEIQHPLATIRGWKATFDTIPVLLVAIPIGKLGDHHGRRKTMALSLFGVAASLVEIFIVCAFPRVFPLQLVWLSSVFLLCGGGLNAASAFMWAMASESIPPSRRSQGFYYIFSAFYVAELVASFLASVTIDISPWLPLGMAMGSVILCLILLWLVPRPKSNVENDAANPSETHSHGNIISENSDKSPAVDSLVSALRNTKFLLIVPVFIVGIFRYTTLNVLIQYASVRFGLKISTGAMFYTETAVVNIFLFLFLVPTLTTYIREKYDVRPEKIDLFLVRASVSLMCCGTLGIGLASSGKLLPIAVFIFAAGFSSRVSALSLVSYWISDDAKATMYAAITVLESLGHCIGDPTMQQILAASLRLPPFWQALPFFFASGLYFLAGISTSLVRTVKT